MSYNYNPYSHYPQYPQYSSAQERLAPINTYGGSQPMTPTRSHGSTGSSSSGYAHSPSSSSSYPSPGSSTSYGQGSGGHSSSPPPKKEPGSKNARQSRSPTSPTPRYQCLFRGCEHVSARPYDLDRHMKTHYPETVSKMDCPYAKGGFCGRSGERGFTRRDHLKEHEAKVHPSRR